MPMAARKKEDPAQRLRQELMAIAMGEKAYPEYGKNGEEMMQLPSLASRMKAMEMLAKLLDSPAAEPAPRVVLVDDAVADLDRKARESILSKTQNAGQVFYAFTELPDDEVFRSSRVVNL